MFFTSSFPTALMTSAVIHSRKEKLSRRAALRRLGALAGSTWAGRSWAAPAPGQRLATFSADVTVPIGHGMMGGAWRARRIGDPLQARGLVLLGPEPPLVFVSVDWCEIRNDAYDRWRSVLAQAAGTTPERVMVSCIHQHDAPVADLAAEQLLRDHKCQGSICDPRFHEEAVQRVGGALRATLPRARRWTHLGTGQARVEKVASNRRYLLPDGTVRFDRTSSTRNVFAIEAEEGLIDPWLRTLSFWDGDTPLAAVHAYAVHPMSYYGQGEVSSDFPGLARHRLQAELPDVFQIYASGCSGNVTAGKYNTGARENRAVLAERLYQGMHQAWTQTRRQPVETMRFRSVPLRLEPRADAGFTPEDLERKLGTEKRAFQQCLAAMGLSWRRRAEAGRAIDVPALDFGLAQWILLPAEAYVEYQLAAQACRPGSWVLVAGYGECAPGYIPTEKHIAEKDPNLADWCWVAPGAEVRMRAVINSLLGAIPQPGSPRKAR